MNISPREREHGPDDERKASAATIEQFVSGQGAPLRVWVGPEAWRRCGAELRERYTTHVTAVPTDEPLDGPAVLVLAAEDLRGPQRAMLRQLAERAKPGRPVVIGGSGHKETLLDAINAWHAFRLIPATAQADSIFDAVWAAHRELSLELAVQLCAEQLRIEYEQLKSTLAELAATQQRLLHAERLATVGRIVGTLMSRAKEHLSTLREFKHIQKLPSDDSVLSEYLDGVVDGIDGFGVLLEDLLALTEDRPIALHLRKEQLDSIVQRSVRLFRHDPLGRRRRIEEAYESEAVVNVDRHRLHQALLNLLRNAAQATEEGGHIRVRTGVRDGSAVIEVEDSGVGMSRDVRAQVFKPFFTTKGKAGMGLGLRLSRSTIEAQGGTLECTSELGLGTCFFIRLPLASR